jgi:hypothetical protein
MTRLCLRLATGVLMVALSVATARAEQDADPTELATALMHAPMTLQDGVRASEARGLPISGKYELEDGVLQLSVYTTDGKTFYEVIVDHTSGAVAKSDELSKPGDIRAAQDQVVAMAVAKTSLAALVDRAVQANAGFRAVGVTPTLKAGRLLANVTLVRGLTFMTVEQAFD